MTIAFTGHREYDAERINDTLYRRVAELASKGGVTFLCGMAVGFDLAAAEAVLEARSCGYDVELKCVVPYVGQSQYFCEVDITRYNRVLESADEVIILADKYCTDVFFRRNDFLVHHADMFIAYFNNINKGGTAYTIRRARRAHIMVENIYPTQQLSLF